MHARASNSKSLVIELCRGDLVFCDRLTACRRRVERDIVRHHPLDMQRGMCQACVKHVSGMLRVCFGHASHMRQGYVGDALGVSPACVAHASRMCRACVAHTSIMRRACTKLATRMRRTCVAHALEMRWVFVGHASSFRSGRVQDASSMCQAYVLRFRRGQRRDLCTDTQSPVASIACRSLPSSEFFFNIGAC